MAGEKIITREDIVLKARMLAEGVRIDLPDANRLVPEQREVEKKKNQAMIDKIDVKNPESLIQALAGIDSVEMNSSDFMLGTDIYLSGSGIPAPVRPNPGSKLSATEDEGMIVISENGKVLGTGKMKSAGAQWKNTPLSNGMPARAFLPGMSAGIINVVFSVSCNNMNTNRGCRYCSLFANPISRRINQLPVEALDMYSRLQGEAVRLAIDSGWWGNIAVSGGALPRHERPKYMERLSLVMDNLREAVGEDSFSKLHIVYNHYPPMDFRDMYKWKQMGFKGTSIDLEVMDPARFAEICPGKNAYKPLEYWKEAQLASVDVFGPLLGTTSCVVMGLEPMDSLLEGVDERVSKGVLPVPLTFLPAPGSVWENESPPTAEWLLEAADRIADIYLKHAAQFVKAAAGIVFKMAISRKGRGALKKAGRSRQSQSVNLTIVFDEVMRRIQDMGPLEKLGLLRGGKS